MDEDPQSGDSLDPRHKVSFNVPSENLEIHTLNNPPDRIFSSVYKSTTREG